MEGVSVILCCHNSAGRLPQTLSHLAAQQVPDSITCEIIVVDNASTDDTATVAVEEWKKSKGKLPLRVVREETPGLSSARRRGITESRFDTLVFCDDDNLLEQSYLKTAFDLMSDKTIGAVGGIGSPSFQTKEPSWFKYVSSYYAVGSQEKSKFNNLQYLYGAGMVVSKQAIAGFTNVMSDRVGDTLLSGGDTELSFAIQSKGYKVIYSDKLKFQHVIPASRLTLSYCNRLIVGIGYSSEKLNGRKNIKLFESAVVLLLPFSRYGKFFEKWRGFLFEYGRYKFQREKK